MAITDKKISKFIDESAFEELFREIGWNTQNIISSPLKIEDGERKYQLYTIAEKQGLQVFVCEIDEGEEMPTAATCKRIDNKLRRNAENYIAIFSQRRSNTITPTFHHLWTSPILKNGKREVVPIEYVTDKEYKFITGKIKGLEFGLEEETTIVEVRERVQKVFELNSEKVTGAFYTEFKKKHDSFVAFISGIDDHITNLKDNRDKQWYASVMLNRLMFCYFVQKKGFFDGNTNYLRDKLKWWQENRKANGDSTYYVTFYRGLLLRLFHDGLNSPEHDDNFNSIYGKIPYLNGGMFDKHQIERDYTDIDIEDEAFENLFAFFDEWRWHLDTRIASSGRDINPDVLGYIFEQYINDRAQMGAYYTKEDITEYIGRNCILPFLIGKAGGLTAEAESILKNSGERYIFDAAKQGFTDDWRERIPADITEGLDTEKPDLLERRKKWNTPTPAPFALPTEIWRETIERLKRTEETKRKIADGTIGAASDFITYNLDIRRFAQDILAQTEDADFILRFYSALRSVSILDPTCGSGAFLFAAMNILEPLYETCIERMQEMNGRDSTLFAEQLGEIEAKYRRNIQYFIFKSIILRNLYGVDIMEEAVEIAKLRLFLKMVAVADVDRRLPNMGIDPLPDIDFNIRCGNTLVGYATKEEVDFILEHPLTFADQQAGDKHTEEIKSLFGQTAEAFKAFREAQLSGTNIEEAKSAKTKLKETLDKLDDILDRYMFEASGAEDIEKWKQTHQPFHWIAEFYSIIEGNGGFDVVIGNPPYVEYNKKSKETGKAISDIYKISGYKTCKCANLYAYVIERSCLLSHNRDNIGFIVPLTIASNNNMLDLRNLIVSQGTSWFSHFEIRPAKLFEGVEQRLTIFLLKDTQEQHIFSTSILRWHSEERHLLFKSIKYAVSFNNGTIWRTSNKLEESIYAKFQKHQPASVKLKKSGSPIHYRTAGIRYWIIFLNNDFGTESLSNKTAYFENKEQASFYMAAFNSNLFWWYYALNFDMFNLKDYMIFAFRLNYVEDPNLSLLGEELEKDMDNKKVEQTINSKTRGIVTTSYYQKKQSKSLIDRIDLLLGSHYGLSAEELDYVVNYDIKYRMGEEL